MAAPPAAEPTTRQLHLCLRYGKAALLKAKGHRQKGAKPISQRRAVELPHAGTSYNPDELARLEVRDSVAMQVVRAIKTNQKRRQALTPRPPKPEPEDLEDAESDPEPPAEILEPHRPRRKTRAERNEEKRMRKAGGKAKRRAMKTKLHQQIDDLDTIAQRMAAKNELKDMLSKVRKEVRDLTLPVKIRRMEGSRFVPRPLPVLPQTEVRHNLRVQDMDVSGANPVLDRFESFMARNLFAVKKRPEKGAYKGPKRRSYYHYSR